MHINDYIDWRKDVFCLPNGGKCRAEEVILLLNLIKEAIFGSFAPHQNEKCWSAEGSTAQNASKNGLFFALMLLRAREKKLLEECLEA